jgi:hypothetical protein
MNILLTAPRICPVNRANAHSRPAVCIQRSQQPVSQEGAVLSVYRRRRRLVHELTDCTHDPAPDRNAVRIPVNLALTKAVVVIANAQ